MSILIDQGSIVILHRFKISILIVLGVVVTLRCKTPWFNRNVEIQISFGPGRVLSFCSTRAIVD